MSNTTTVNKAILEQPGKDDSPILNAGERLDNYSMETVDFSEGATQHKSNDLASLAPTTGTVPPQTPANGDIEVVITQEILDMNPGMAEEGIKVGDEVTFPADGEVTLADALELARQDAPTHTFTVQDGKVYVIHNSVPTHLYESTGIFKKLDSSDGRKGPHSVLAGDEDDIIGALLRIKNWI